MNTLVLHRQDCQIYEGYDCTCDGPQLLTELVDSAIHAIYIGNYDADARLDKALEPFRTHAKPEEKPFGFLFVKKTPDAKPARKRTLKETLRKKSLT